MTPGQKGLLAFGSSAVAIILLLSVWLGDVGGAIGTRLTLTALIAICWLVCAAVSADDS